MNDVLTKIEKNLNSIINCCLYDVSSDPTYEHLESASLAYKSLKLLNLNIELEDEVMQKLQGENLYEENFLK